MRAFKLAMLSGGYDQDARAYFAAMQVQPSSVIKDTINRFIIGLKTDGLWSKIDGGHVLAAPTQQAALVDFKTPSRVATLVLTPTFTANQGFTGTGAVGEYIDTGFVPSTMGVAYQQDSASIGTFLNSNIPSNAIPIGTSVGSGAYFVSRNTSNNLAYRINDVTTVTSAGSTDGSGLTIVSRTGPNATQAYQRGAAFGAAGTNASTTRPTASIKYLTAGVGASGLFQVGAGFFGGGLTGSEVAALTVRVNALIAALTAIS